ncbi:MAG: GlsB/YeaQ/YmgE family stress response membrane protein [Acidimicrobiales bacterium]
MLWLLLIVLIALFIVFPIIGLAIGTIISSIVVGLVIGALGRLVIPGRQSIGLLATVMLGLIGSIVGGFIARHVFHIGGLSILLEIGVAAVAVALYAARPGQKQLKSPDGLDRWR